MYKLPTRPYLVFIISLSVLLLLSGCLKEQSSSSADLMVASPEASADWYTVYFTNPDDPQAEKLRGGPDEALAAAIAQARLSVDVAIYDLDLWSIRDALLEAHQRGVIVRLVTDSDNLENDEVQELKDAGIEVLGDRREGLMHDKFVVIDRLEVWGGSMNFTMNDAYKNNNNLIRLRSSKLAQDYTTEFEEMFTDDLFGAAGRSRTPYPSLTIDGTRVEVYYSPDDGVAKHLVELIHSAQESIYFMAFSFTSDEIAAAMLERADAGVTVAGVFEKTQVAANTGNEYDTLRSAGLDVRIDGNPRNMHHKVLIVDGAVVVTGSYNFTNNAEKRNDENLMILYNAQIAARYKAEFDKIYEQAKVNTDG
jgi:phosphatidylserine/phosphatidylglycerophosphate/cardiolipin synthase-like enzyme